MRTTSPSSSVCGRGDEDGAETIMRLHLSRLNETLDDAQKNNPAYFED